MRQAKIDAIKLVFNLKQNDFNAFQHHISNDLISAQMLRNIYSVKRPVAIITDSDAFLGQFLRHQLQQTCWKATAAPQAAVNNEAVDESFLAEWNAAKPYEKIPGRRSLPILGTGWVMMPIVGK